MGYVGENLIWVGGESGLDQSITIRGNWYLGFLNNRLHCLRCCRNLQIVHNHSRCLTQCPEGISDPLVSQALRREEVRLMNLAWQARGFRGKTS